MRSLVRGAMVAGVLCCGIGQAVAAAEPGFAADSGPASGAGSGTGPDPDSGAHSTGPVQVDVSSDVAEPRTGDVVTYTVRVKNVSDHDFPRLTVFQLIPAGFHVTDTEPPATTSDHNGPEWTADLPAGGAGVFSVTATAGTVADYEHTKTATRPRSNPAPASGATPAKPPAAKTTVTTTACARAGVTGPSLACGTARQILTDDGSGGDGPATWRPGVLAFGFAVVAAVFLRSRVRRRFGRKERG